MKNFYYAKVRKDLEDLYLVPSHRYRSGKRYPIKRNLSPKQSAYALWPSVATKSVDTTFFMKIHQYDMRLHDKPQYGVSIAHMESLVDHYSDRNPAFSFTFDPTDFVTHRFDKHGRQLTDDSTKRQPHPRQAFGTAIYRRFTRNTYNHVRL